MAAVLTWTPPGPVALAFVQSTLPIAAIMGPRGGGKTSALAAKIMLRSTLQPRSRIDGIRRYRCIVIRDLYRRFQRTTYPTLRKWIRPEWSRNSTDPDTGERCIYSTPQDAPGVQTFVWNDGFGPIKVWIDFIALGDLTVEELMQGYETTDACLNEWTQLPEDTVAHVAGSMGRYPGAEHCRVENTQLFGDFNAPAVDHYLYRMMVEDCSSAVGFYRQPGGRELGAENLANLPASYYQQIVARAPKWYVRRMVDNQWGYDRSGEPVYDEEWDDDFHVARATLEPVRGIPIAIGVDPGKRGPAAIIGQELANGQHRILHEVVGRHVGVEEFGDAVLAVLARRFAGFEVEFADMDPYAFNDMGHGFTWADAFRARTRLKVRRAKTSAIAIRHDAVRRQLSRRIGPEPAFLLCPTHCPMLRRGFNADYRYRRLPSGRSIEPEKNEYADPHDALQNLEMGFGGFDLVVRPNRSSGTRVPRIVRPARTVTWGARP